MQGFECYHTHMFTGFYFLALYIRHFIIPFFIDEIFRSTKYRSIRKIKRSFVAKLILVLLRTMTSFNKNIPLHHTFYSYEIRSRFIQIYENVLITLPGAFISHIDLPNHNGYFSVGFFIPC